MLSACGHLTRQIVDPPDEALAQEPLHAAVDRLVRPVLDARETPGLVVGVATPDGRRHFFAYGSSETSGAPLGPDTQFPIGSLTKGYVGALLAVLVDEGALHWDDTLAELLPALKTTPAAGQLTLLQLATHQAGLPRQPTTLGMLTGLVRFTFTGSNFYGELDDAGIARFMADFKPPAAPPPAYSNIGYALVGMAIEARTGRRLDALLAEKVLAPLGLRHTGFTPDSAHRAQGHAGDQPYFMPRGRPVRDWQFPAAMQGSAALYSTASDLLDFAVAHLDGDRDRLHARLADNLRVRHPQPQDAPGIAWVTDDVGGTAITNQVGMAVGHTAYVGVQAQRRLAVVVLQTSFNWNFKIGHRLLLRLARGQIDTTEDSPEARAQTMAVRAPIIAAARQDGPTAPATP
jgi:CubicO group peptidase (beta-lactamase class C family)